MCLERLERNVNEGARMTYLCHSDIEKIDWTAMSPLAPTGLAVCRH
jgi:hypothetical protein